MTGDNTPDANGVVRDLARATAVFQLRAILAAKGFHPDTVEIVATDDAVRARIAVERATREVSA
jgi:hypothetical protein